MILYYKACFFQPISDTIYIDVRRPDVFHSTICQWWCITTDRGCSVTSLGEKPSHLPSADVPPEVAAIGSATSLWFKSVVATGKEQSSGVRAPHYDNG